MCCQSIQQPVSHFQSGFNAARCGCGCIGRAEAPWNLENYREHLKAELAWVEKQIHDSRKTEP